MFISVAFDPTDHWNVTGNNRLEIKNKVSNRTDHVSKSQVKLESVDQVKFERDAKAG